MSRFIPEDGMALVRRVLSDVITPNRDVFLSFGLLGVLWTASGGFANAIEALNIAYYVEETRPFWKTRLLAVGLSFLIGFLLLVALAVMIVGTRSAQATTLDTSKIAKIVGHDGEQNGAVYKITIGRDDMKLKEMGAVINSRMGLNTWAAFYGTNENSAVAGDVAMLEKEVTPTLKALRSHGLDVVAIHHQMLSTQPAVVFLHYWGQGKADDLATGFKAALDQLGH